MGDPVPQHQTHLLTQWCRYNPQCHKLMSKVPLSRHVQHALHGLFNMLHPAVFTVCVIRQPPTDCLPPRLCDTSPRGVLLALMSCTPHFTTFKQCPSQIGGLAWTLCLSALIGITIITIVMQGDWHHCTLCEALMEQFQAIPPTLNPEQPSNHLQHLPQSLFE